MSKKILNIAEKFIKDTDIAPHMNCIIATRKLITELRENNIEVYWSTYFVDVTHYNGKKHETWRDNDRIEHHCIQYKNQILDVTASQFNDQNGQTMPRIFFGQLPNFYLENI